MEKIESGKLLDWLKKFWKMLEKDFDKLEYETKDKQDERMEGCIRHLRRVPQRRGIVAAYDSCPQ